jgi:PPM family protein phosphatase
VERLALRGSERGVSQVTLPTVSQTVPRFDFRVTFEVAEDIGRSRAQHEDAYLVAPELALFAVADGMGGHAAGEIAARLAIEAVRESIAGEVSQRVIDAYVRSPTLETRRKVFTRLRRAVEYANEKVRTASLEDEARRGMGTTLDVAWFVRDHVFVAHAGDSRVYLARANAVLQLTQDHAEIETLKASGLLSPHGRANRANRLLNAVGLKDTVVVDTLFVDVTRGDRILLCTDGVHGQIPGESDLGELLRLPTAEEAARGLVAKAGLRGRDNATAVVVEVGEPFVKRKAGDQGMRAKDLERARSSPLLLDLPLGKVMGALAAAVEIEVAEGQIVPQVVANDLVSYVVLEGMVRLARRRLVSVGALLFAESLVGVSAQGELPVTESHVRLLRLRADDFSEVCRADAALGLELYRRLATHLARAIQAQRPAESSDRPRAEPEPAPAPQASAQKDSAAVPAVGEGGATPPAKPPGPAD